MILLVPLLLGAVEDNDLKERLGDDDDGDDDGWRGFVRSGRPWDLENLKRRGLAQHGMAADEDVLFPEAQQRAVCKRAGFLGMRRLVGPISNE